MAEGSGRATYLAYRYLGEAMAAVPEPVAATAAAVVGAAMARRRKVIEHDSGGVRLDDQLLERLVRRSFQSYARYWMEGARLPRTPAGEVDQRMMFEEGGEHLRAGMAAGRGVIMALPHVGSWEWGGSWLSHIGYPMTAVAEVLEPPELDRWFVAQRRDMGLAVVPLDDDASATVLKVLRAGKLVGLLCDRDLAGNGIEVEFFGERTTFPAGPAVLALRARATLIAAAVYSGPGRQHRAAISAPVDLSRTGSFRADVARITQELARLFEGFIQRAPEQWHLFQPNWPSDATDDPVAGVPAPGPGAPAVEGGPVGEPGPG